MSTEIVLYTHPLSRGRVARWMLEETGLPYQAVILDYGTTMKAPDYLAINPMGKVPALRHGEAVVTENAAICAYLPTWCRSGTWRRRRNRRRAPIITAGCFSWPAQWRRC